MTHQEIERLRSIAHAAIHRTRLDPNVAYARFTQHVARCAECDALSPGLCDAARQFLQAWGASERAENKLTETDVFLDCAEDAEFWREAQREAMD